MFPHPNVFPQPHRSPTLQPQHRTLSSYQSTQQYPITTATRPHSTYDQQFHLVYTEITHHPYFTKITKHQKIRINKWLTKLSNISTNDLWKKNRNNYIKLIRLMFDCEVIIAPFLMMPPDRDLHKLTTHEINVIIDQVDKVIDQREGKMQGIGGGKTTSRDRFNKVEWTQQSSYVDHRQDTSVDRFKENSQTTFKKTQQSSAITAKMSKLTQAPNLTHIPPKYPSHSTKSPITQQKTPTTQKNSSHFIKPAKSPESSPNGNYFKKKERFNTFQTEEMGQQEYLALMRSSSLERCREEVFQKENYDIHTQCGNSNISLQTHSHSQAINILKCGFKLLEKLPLHSLEDNNSLQQLQTFRRIMSENDFLKQEFEKESAFLEVLSTRNATNRTPLDDVKSLNGTQKVKIGEKKKMKLTLLSQASTNRA